jgi:hypothetical protein
MILSALAYIESDSSSCLTLTVSDIFLIFYKNKIFYNMYISQETNKKIFINCVILMNSRTPCGLTTVSKRCKG